MSDSPQSETWTLSTEDSRFQEDVFDRSQQVPVVVDFWAEWCAPCRMLGPLLEKLAAEYAGRFVLVKANTDAVPQAANAFQVQSIPAVYAVLDGQVVNSFAGALPESQLRTWIDQVLGTAELGRLAELENSDPVEAERRYRERTEANPGDSASMIGLARLLLAQDRLEDTATLLERLESRGFLEPEAEKLKSAIELRGNATLDVAGCRDAVAATPGDLPARLRLAEALAGAAEYEEALEICLELVEQDRAGVGEQARVRMLDIFRVLPDDSPLVGDFRRKLSLALY